MRRIIKPLAVVTAIGMFAVLVMGATVTSTGSEQGCGKSWPLCHGQLIPQFAVATFIEFSHRAVVGIVTPLIIALAASSLYLYRSRLEIRILAPLMVVFLFLQAGLGAWAVMYPQVSAVLALHFGVSLVSFASVLLTALYIFEVDGFDALRDVPIAISYRWAVWAVAAYSYVVIYLGAYVRHVHADLACVDWPRCNGAWVPGLSGAVGYVFAHRLAAAVLAGCIVALLLWSWGFRSSRPDLFRASAVSLTAVVLQALSGAVVVYSRLDIFSALAHAALAGLLFGSLAYLCLHALPRSAARASRVPRAFSAQPSEPAGAQRSS